MNSQNVIDRLNILLSEYRKTYSVALWYHWNVKGENFFELHEIFGRIYTKLQERIDILSERIISIGGKINSEILNFVNSNNDNLINTSEYRQMVRNMIDLITKSVGTKKDICSESFSTGDYGTFYLLAEIINDDEKLLWMLQSFLEK